MPETYAIIDDEHGWSVNLVVWDGNTETWSPPPGTHAVKVSEIDLNSLPQRPVVIEE